MIGDRVYNFRKRLSESSPSDFEETLLKIFPITGCLEQSLSVCNQEDDQKILIVKSILSESSIILIAEAAKPINCKTL
ncbi:MAG: hypothetical protein K8R21_01600 [Leptospira sp.]|nr:hypothetical protein [Leptospira sp.]